MKFDSKKPFDAAQGGHHHRSIRIKGFDYTQSGGYFITIVTYHRDLLFGNIVNGEMQLNDSGMTADECWRAIPEHFPNIELGAIVRSFKSAVTRRIGRIQHHRHLAT